MGRDPNRYFDPSNAFNPAVHALKLQNSRIYVGSTGLSEGNDWRYLMAVDGQPASWAGSFDSLMVIPYGVIPLSPTFPGSLPDLADLILGTSASGPGPGASAVGPPEGGATAAGR